MSTTRNESWALEVLDGTQRGQRHPLCGDEVVVGRQPSRDPARIALSDPSVSRDHAVLTWDGSAWQIANRSQTNPTRVNGRSIKEQALAEGDEIKLGRVVLLVHVRRFEDESGSSARDRSMRLRSVSERGPLSVDGMPTKQVRIGDGPRVALDPRRGSTIDATPPVARRRRAETSSRNPMPSTERVELSEMVLRASRGLSARDGPATRRAIPVFSKRRPHRIDLAQMMSHLSIMLTAGIPLARALDGLADKGPTPAVRGVCGRLLLSVEQGYSLSAAMREQPLVFTRVHADSVAAAESSGRLAQVLRDLAMWEERDLALVRTVAAGLRYPMTVFVCGLLVVGILGNRVFAALRPLFANSGQPLPLVSRVLFAVSDALQQPLFILAAVVISTFVLAVGAAWLRTSQGVRVRDRLVLRVPALAGLLRKLFVARFCSHLNLLYAAGLPMLPALQTAVGAAGQTAIGAAVGVAATRLANGELLSEALRGTGQFPGMAISMIAVGETTGRLDFMLSKLADFYDEEVYRALDALVKLAEPFVIVGMGVLVSIIVLGTTLPLYQLVRD